MEPVRGGVPEPGFFVLSGLEQLRAYLDGRMPSTPHCHLLGYRVTQVSLGAAVISQPIGPWFEVYDGFVDLIPTAELSVYVAALTVAPPATHVRTVTLSVRYLRPCTVDEGSVIARGRVIHAGSNFTTVETLIEDALGRAVAHATGCVLSVPIHPPPAPLPYPLDVQIDEPAYATPDPSRRGVPAILDRGGLPLAGVFLGLQVVEAGEASAVTTMASTEWFCNMSREVEPGIVAAHANVSAALLNGLVVEPDKRAVTFETTSSFLTAVPADGRPLTATATLRAKVGEVFVLDVESVNADGQQVLVGGGTLLQRERRPRQRTRPSNRVLLTVLFTDVVGSTERAGEVGDARWRELLDEHHAIVRQQIASHRGREVKTTGDGFLVTFDSPSSAVQCARAIRDGVARLGLEIRAGVHTGECELVGSDVAGIAIHVAARVQAAASPGQVLVSRTVRDLVSGSGLQFTDRGLHELKGLEGSWPLLSLE